MKFIINTYDEFLESVRFNENSGEMRCLLSNCTITCKIRLSQFHNFRFSCKNCSFEDEIIFESPNILLFEFDNCQFHKKVNFNNFVFNCNVRFYKCSFNEVSFINTQFNKLVDFWRSTFNKSVIFLKTDFNGVAVFSAATFIENVLFTYAKIREPIFFRGTKFEKGLDFSLAVSTGVLGVFDMRLKDYLSYDTLGLEDEDGYENAVTETAAIPLRNKQETFRILKKRFEDLGDIPSSLYFKTIEKRCLMQSLRKNPPSSKKFTHKSDKFSLWLNLMSNDFGKSYFRAFIFTIIVGLGWFLISIIFSGKYMLNVYAEFAPLNEILSDFVKFMNPTHKIDYLTDSKGNYWLFYLFDFIGRGFVGYGTYQFIQAFRKYR